MANWATRCAMCWPSDQRFNAIYTDVAGDDVTLLDITDEAAVEQMVGRNAIQVIVNCVAYTAVDAAEDDETTAARLNADAVGILARVAKRHGARVVHVSTDYVFDGNGCIPYTEDMPTCPQSAYGRTKLDGERLLIDTLGDDAIILRTAWLYSPYGKNFVKTMLTLGQSKPALKVVFDQVGSPTCARDLARAIVTAITAPEWHPGIYHYSNEGVISWYDFTWPSTALQASRHVTCSRATAMNSQPRPIAPPTACWTRPSSKPPLA